MYAHATDHLLYYKITPDAHGFRLRLWETPQTADGQPGSYLYIINFRVDSVEEAKALLTRHLALNGGALACNQEELPQKGKIRLMAYPTWNGDEN